MTKINMHPVFSPDHPHTVFVPKRGIPINSGNNVFRIRQISDTHQDADGFRLDLFRYFVNEQAKDKDSVWIHTGDLPDSDRPSTRMLKAQMFADRQEANRAEDKKITPWLDRIAEAYKKIRESCLGIIDGDHYTVLSDGMTSGQYISRKLRVMYLGERSSFVRLNFYTKDFKQMLRYIIHARHGKSCAPTHGGDVNALIKQSQGQIADLYLGGHSHKSNAHVQREEYVSCHGALRDKLVTYMRGGSFLDGFPKSKEKTYAYRKEYNPLPCGWGEVELHIGRSENGVSGGGKSGCPEIRMIKASVIAA